MSRCRACNRILKPFELTRKSVETGEYLDLCNTCFSSIADVVAVKERYDLMSEDDVLDDDMGDLEEDESTSTEYSLPEV